MTLVLNTRRFKCPRCDEWFIEKTRVRSHLVAHHIEPKGFKIEGKGDKTIITRDNMAVESEKSKVVFDTLKKETGEAWIITIDGKDYILPKSMCDVEGLEITIPDWLIKDRELEDYVVS